MRGQAHVVFQDIPKATQGMRSLQGYEFFGKKMVRMFDVSHEIFLSLLTEYLGYSIRKVQVQLYREARWYFQPASAQPAWSRSCRPYQPPTVHFQQPPIVTTSATYGQRSRQCR